MGLSIHYVSKGKVPSCVGDVKIGEWRTRIPKKRNRFVGVVIFGWATAFMFEQKLLVDLWRKRTANAIQSSGSVERALRLTTSILRYLLPMTYSFRLLSSLPLLSKCIGNETLWPTRTNAPIKSGATHATVSAIQLDLSRWRLFNLKCWSHWQCLRLSHQPSTDA